MDKEKLVQNETNSEVVEQLDYRGQHLDFYLDEPGQQIYTVFNNEEIGFGTFNTNYIADAKYIIDKYLDNLPTGWTIDSPYFGATLSWFKNKKTNMWNLRLNYRSQKPITTWDFRDDFYKIQDDIPPKLSTKTLSRFIKLAESKLDSILVKRIKK